jgi:PASTA domain
MPKMSSEVNPTTNNSWWSGAQSLLESTSATNGRRKAILFESDHKMEKTMRALLLGAVPLVMMMSTPLAAQQVTPVPQPTIVPLIGTENASLTGGAAPKVIVSKDITLSEGQMVHVFGSLAFTSDAGTTDGSTDYVDVWAECLDPNKNLVPMVQDIGQNFLGPKTPTGLNYPEPGILVLSPSTLITAPLGSGTKTYSCQLLAGAQKNGSVVPGSSTTWQGPSSTWLGLSTPINPPDAFSWGRFDGCFWQGPNVGTGQDEAHDDKDCMYLGGANGAKSVDLFSPTVLLPTTSTGACLRCAWSLATQPDPTASAQTDSRSLARPAMATTLSPVPAAFVDATATLMVSMCGDITDECDRAKFGSNDTTSVTIDSYFELDQLDAAGNLVHTPLSSVISNVVIDHLTHHQMIFHTLSNVPVYPSSGPPQFRPKLVVTWNAGSTAKVDGAQVVAFTSFHGHAQLVPNVVGLNLSTATNTLITSGYAAGAVSNVLGTDPSGTVVSQSPLGRSEIELPGSPVNLSVSAPHTSVSVPSVITLDPDKAQDIITKALLVPKLSYAKSCTYPGEVAVENPRSGSVVPAGSTIILTVDSGTRATCGPPK